MRRALTLLSAAVLLGLACSAPAPAAKPAASPVSTPATPAAAPAPATVIVGYLPVTIAAPVYLAIEKGYFNEQGITIDLQLFTSGGEVLTQTAGGHLNIGTAASVGSAALNALQSGVDVKILGTGHAESRANPTTNFVLRKVDGRPFSVSELRGRKVAINSIGVATEYVLALGLATADLRIEDIDLQQIPFPDMVAALTNGSIDAAVMAEPFITRVAQQDIAEPMQNIVPDKMQTTVTYINTRWAASNTDVARRFTVAWLKAIRELQGDAFSRDDVAEIVAKYTRLEPAVIKASAMPYFDPSGRPNVESIMEQQRFFLSRGSLRYTDLLDIRQYIDDSFVEYAARQLGS
ncbi:MAG: ABC transporter substrate-binding protein [Chloroflexi bacterium]|nr:ABC transporter substrate-binding protein [Chloroflexota bacterium]